MTIPVPTTGESFKTKIFRILINLYPMFFGTGGKVLFIKRDWTHAIVRLKLGLWTRNYVGTIFGGSQFAATDPFLMVLLINILGKEYVVWDKSARIEFKKPGKGTLKVEFIYSEEELKTIREITQASGKYEFQKSVSWIDEKYEVVSTIEKTIYVATKEYFRGKKLRKDPTKS